APAAAEERQAGLERPRRQAHKYPRGKAPGFFITDAASRTTPCDEAGPSDRTPLSVMQIELRSILKFALVRKATRGVGGSRGVQKKAPEHRSQAAGLALRSRQRELLSELLGVRHGDGAQAIRVGMGIKRRKMAEDDPAISDIIQHRIGNIAVLDPESAGEGTDLVRQQLGSCVLAGQRLQRRPILVARAGLVLAPQHDPRSAGTKALDVADIGQVALEQKP